MILPILLDADVAAYLARHLLLHLEPMDGTELEGEELEEAQALDNACMAICQALEVAGLIEEGE